MSLDEMLRKWKCLRGSQESRHEPLPSNSAVQTPFGCSFFRIWPDCVLLSYSGFGLVSCYVVVFLVMVRQWRLFYF